MRILKATLLVTAVLAVAGPALAFGPANHHDTGDGYDTTDLRGVTSVDVQCYPSFDSRDRDRDPVAHTDIDVTFQPNSDLLIQSFVVNHTLASGRIINRDHQYEGTTWKKPRYFEWHWEGRQYDDQRIAMQATLVRTQRGEWRYQESVYRDGRLYRALPAMHCDRVGEDAQ
jgi:hypothetical protein